MSLVANDPRNTSVRAEPRRGGVYQSYNDREYYSISPEMSAPEIQIDNRLLQEAAYMESFNDVNFKELVPEYFAKPTDVFIFINEKGGVDGIRRVGWMGLPIHPALEKELMSLKVHSPASFSGKPVPSWLMLTIDPPGYIK